MTSFEQTYARLYPSVVRSAWSICRDGAHAEELAQEAFVRAYRRWSRLEHSGYVEPWVHRTAMNLALNHMRRAGRGRVLEAFGLATPTCDVSANGAGEVVELLRDLPRRQREAVFLRVVADLPEIDVAALMGCSTGTVKVHKKRGLDRLRERLEGGDHDARAAVEAARG